MNRFIDLIYFPGPDPGGKTSGATVVLVRNTEVIGNGRATGCYVGAGTHLILRLGTSVHTAADGSVMIVGMALAPGVTGSLSVRVVVRAEALIGHEARKRRSLEHSQNGGPQAGDPGPKTTSVQETVEGRAAVALVDVKAVWVTWLGQSE